MSVRNYVKHEVVLNDQVVYTGPSRTALNVYDILLRSLGLCNVPIDSYTLVVRLCL